MKEKAEMWSSMWCKGSEHGNLLYDDVMELLRPAKLQLASWPRLDMAMVEKAIKATPSKTALGFDRMACR
eukprot:11466295-Heterocapsa_arctica.AAC.1